MPLAVFAVFVVVLGVFMFGLYRIVLHSYAQIERQDLEADVARARVALMSSTDSLKAASSDWAVWTDAHRYVAGTNPAFEENLSEEALENLGIDFMALYTLDGEVVWAATLDRRGGVGYAANTAEARKTFEVVAPQLRPETSEVPLTGIVLLGSRPALFASSSIVDNGRLSAPNGYLVMGTQITLVDAERITSITGLDVEVAPATGSVQMVANGQPEHVRINEGDRRTIVGSITLKTVAGEPALRLTVNRVRNSFQRAHGTLELVSWALLAAVLTFAIALAVTLDRTILQRLGRLHRFVMQDAPSRTAHQCVGGTDEIADLAVGLDHALKRAEDTEKLLKHQADHDYLTGLPNRRRLRTDIERSIGEARRTGGRVSLLLMDLDRFKEINDSYGHAGGDEALRCFAQRARSAVRDYSTVARIGGDEFAILLPNTDRIGANQVAERLKELLAKDPCVCSGYSFHLRTSVGVAVYPDDGDDPETLLGIADAGMYEDKRARRRNAG